MRDDDLIAGRQRKQPRSSFDAGYRRRCRRRNLP